MLFVGLTDLDSDQVQEFMEILKAYDELRDSFEGETRAEGGKKT